MANRNPWGMRNTIFIQGYTLVKPVIIISLDFSLIRDELALHFHIMGAAFSLVTGEALEITK